MQEVMISIFGTYSPIDGCADWSYIGGVVLFSICLYSLFRLAGGIFKR